MELGKDVRNTIYLSIALLLGSINETDFMSIGIQRWLYAKIRNRLDVDLAVRIDSFMPTETTTANSVGSIVMWRTNREVT